MFDLWFFAKYIFLVLLTFYLHSHNVVQMFLNSHIGFLAYSLILKKVRFYKMSEKNNMFFFFSFWVSYSPEITKKVKGVALKRRL